MRALESLEAAKPILGHPRLTDVQAQSVLLDFYDHVETRLAYGAAVRESIKEGMRRGERHSSYRSAWLQSAGLRLVRELKQIARDFNKTYDFDLCSSNDLLDVLLTAQLQLQKLAQEDGAGDDAIE